MITRLFFTIVFLLVCSSQAHAFIFTDLIAKAQRIIMISDAAKHLEEFQKYQAEFDRYKQEFDRYFINFRQVYRRLSSSDWRGLHPGQLEPPLRSLHWHLEDV
jgi:Skp family chaperone for outer membrane proteins